MSGTAINAPRSLPAPLHRLMLRNGWALPVAASLVWIVGQRIATADPAVILTTIAGISAPQWAASVLFAALSYAAIGEYDRMFHRLSDTGLGTGPARTSGMVAMALAQMLGFGVISGALVRWRLVPQFDLWRATRFSALVSASFLAGFAVLTALASKLSDHQHLPAGSDGLATLVLLAALALVAASLVVRCVHIRDRIVMLPPVRRLFRILLIVTADCTAAAACAYVLLPDGMTDGLLSFLPVFLLASGAGLISGAPAGLGAYELTLLALLPVGIGADGSAVSGDAILASALAFRLVYHALPASLAALLAIAMLVRGSRPVSGQAAADQSFVPATALPSPEAGLLHQGRLSLWQGQGSAFLGAATGQALVALFDPAGCPDAALSLLSSRAAAGDRFPCLYKIGARMAVIARHRGFIPWRIAEEAVLNPTGFSLATPGRATLRRKLRRADAAGLRCTVAVADPLLLSQLAVINDEWSLTHGGERGFSMGRFDRVSLGRQKLFVAVLDGVAVAFVSFHHARSNGRGCWTLDLMRHRDAVPDGTMHALITTAIGAARVEGVTQLSLAAVPAIAMPTGRHAYLRLVRFLFGAASRRWPDGGLRRFKQSFEPCWKPLYAAAPDRWRLAVALAEVAAEIHRPLPRATVSADGNATQLPVCLAAPVMR
ncbi:MAG: phosphatidylglycerol lysyltransferase domain-containing protein [Paracoccaceae bacterium]